jgi:crotonobetainyl-CoA:carnitine CoA-transferase CaiB-like acyl-CoA transferase
VAGSAGRKLLSHVDGALAGLRVLDLSETIAGQFCGRLLSDYGAEVVLVEPRDGSAVRRMGPFSRHDGSSLLFWHLNTGKRSLALDLATQDGARMFGDLASSADVLLASSGIDHEALRARWPRLVVCLVSDFGEGSSLSRWIGSELIHQALSGVMFVTGEAHRPPLYGLGHRASYACGVTAYISVLTALQARAVSGAGQVVEATVAESVAAMAPPDGFAQYAYNGGYARRGSYPNPIALLRCRDGWVVMFGLRNWDAMCEVFDAGELAADERFATPAARVQNQEWRAVLQARAEQLGVEEVMERSGRARVTVGRVMTPADLWSCPHLRARGYWESVQLDGRERPILGPLFRMSATPRRVIRGAPRLDEAGEAV